MIELLIAALIQLGTITADASTASATNEVPQQTTTTTTTTDGNPGGTGTWDDGN
jgi:hypothetical protein